jgi:probable HAF family extracellular repeat protein
MKTAVSMIRAEFGILLAIALLGTLVVAPQFACAATFQGIGFLSGQTATLPQALSADGAVVVGQSGSHAFRWTAGTGMIDLGMLPGDVSAGAYAVNADGTVVSGASCNSTPSCNAFRWTAATGMVSLGRLAGDNTAVGFGISADGSVVAGTSSGAAFHAFRWTAATGMVDLGILPGDNGATALAVSADGSVIVGAGTTVFATGHAFRWTAANGMVSLGTLPGDTAAVAQSVSADGSVIVGLSKNNNTGEHSFRWTAATGMVRLDPIPGDTQSVANGVNGDGSVVVGESLGTSLPHASRWTAATGMQSVAELLTQAGVDISGWTLFTTKSVSADGNTMTANGTDPNGKGQGWIATLGAGPPPPPPTTLFDSVLPSSRSVQVGTTATVGITVANAGTNTAFAVGISLASAIPASLTFNQTDCVTTVIGGTNVPVDIPGNKAIACFVVSITPTAPFPPTEVAFNIAGTNTPPVTTIVQVNTLLLSASLTPVPDIIAEAATITNDGILHIPGPTGSGAFAVATFNFGALGDVITVSANTASAVLPLGLSICETDPLTGMCITPIGPSVSVPIAPAATPTFGIFGTASGTIVTDLAANRIFVVFTDSGGVIRGRTSVAVTTQ